MIGWKCRLFEMKTSCSTQATRSFLAKFKSWTKFFKYRAIWSLNRRKSLKNWKSKLRIETFLIRIRKKTTCLWSPFCRLRMVWMPWTLINLEFWRTLIHKWRKELKNQRRKILFLKKKNTKYALKKAKFFRYDKNCRKKK
jgi:hypothetical protein